MIELALGDGAALAVDASTLTRDESAAELPPLELAGIAGVTLIARRGFTDGRETVRVACLRAASDRWAPGVEGLVLDHASALAKKTLPTVERWSVSSVTPVADRFEQTLEGRSEHQRAAIHHVLGFVGPEHDAVLCTTTCVGPEAGSCVARVEATRALGAFVAPPAPSLWVRAILAAATRPHEAAGLGVALVFMAIGVVLWRRPRPRP
jgi:hypothetical protein